MALRNNGLFISLMSKSHTFWYQLLGGAGPLGQMGKAPVLLLTTVGRKSGRRRTTPLMYGRDGDTVVVIASNSGADRDPGWWRNLKAHPDATIQIKRVTIAVRAEQASPDEKARLWSEMAKVYPAYDEYQMNTVRLIPLVLLKPAVST
jgi:deazaflavin-dependent oxidoreductase (nitroreductase family)